VGFLGLGIGSTGLVKWYRDVTKDSVAEVARCRQRDVALPPVSPGSRTRRGIERESFDAGYSLSARQRLA
jgi:hypothetical protein